MEKARFLTIPVTLSLLALAAPSHSRAAEAAEVNVNITPRLRYQTVEGWGSSLCWWANMVGKWTDEKKINEIIDLVVSPDKLNMNIFRYNIGGGDDPSHVSVPGRPGHMSYEMGGNGIRAEMEGFKASPDAPYDWTRDAGQIKILLKLKQKRPDIIFEAFSNSPPWWMTYSGCASGNDPASADNLKPEYYDAFCDYLVAVCRHFKDAYGIEFRTLEPFNEPQTPFWHYKGKQEGCHFDLSTQIEIIKRLYPRLQKSGLKTVIAAADETRLSNVIVMLNAYMDNGRVLDYVGQLNVHTYNATDAERMTVANLVKKSGKRFWQSETGTFETNGFASVLNLGQKCIADMRIMKPVAWLDWQVVSPNESKVSIVNPLNSPDDGSYILSRHFFVRMQVTRFVKQGYTIIDSDQENTLAALSPSGKELVLCFINMSGKENTIRFNLSTFASTGAADVYTTGATQDCEKGAAVSADSRGVLEISAAGQTVTTLVVPVTLKK